MSIGFEKGANSRIVFCYFFSEIKSEKNEGLRNRLRNFCVTLITLTGLHYGK
jgi:hypothetical protein